MYETHPHFRPVGSGFGCGYAADVGWLRFYPDDAAYGDRDVCANEQSWEALRWMSSREVQSFNSVGVLTYGGKYSAATIQYDLIDMAATKAAVKTNLDKWYAELDANINAILNEL